MAADLDGDGIGDALIAGLNLSADAAGNPTGSRTAIARSGRDGRLLWKAALAPPRFWFGRTFARSYALAAFPSPAGDLDGDGVPDVLVRTHANDGAEIGRRAGDLAGRGPLGTRWAAALVSGASACAIHGPRLLAGRLVRAPRDRVWLPARPGGAPPQSIPQGEHDTSAAIYLGPGAGAARARLGRTGRILWDIPLEARFSIQQPGWPQAPHIDDLDGDGALDAALIVQRAAQNDPGESEVKVFSLRDGKPLWSRRFDYPLGGLEHPQLKLGRRKDDGRTLVFVEEKPDAGAATGLAVHALVGRDGTIIWTWRAGVGKNPSAINAGFEPFDFDGNGKDSVCLSVTDSEGEPHILILDNRGRERMHRDLSREKTGGMSMIPGTVLDLDGDGRDEMVVWYDNRLRAWGRDLKELWSVPSAQWRIEQILPSSPGHPSTADRQPGDGHRRKNRASALEREASP